MSFSVTDFGWFSCICESCSRTPCNSSTIAVSCICIPATYQKIPIKSCDCPSISCWLSSSISCFNTSFSSMICFVFCSAVSIFVLLINFLLFLFPLKSPAFPKLSVHKPSAASRQVFLLWKYALSDCLIASAPSHAPLLFPILPG